MKNLRNGYTRRSRNLGTLRRGPALLLLRAMLAMGIDPGTRRLGWGVVNRTGNRIQHVAHGVVRLDPEQSLALRLRDIDSQLAVLVALYRPEVGSVETMFFNKDAQAAAKLGQARGVVLAGLARQGVEVVEYAPAHIKRTVTGRGNATKDQVARMVRTVLGLEEEPPSDAADALAMALTHLRAAPLSLLVRARTPTARKTSGRRQLAALIRAQRGM